DLLTLDIYPGTGHAFDYFDPADQSAMTIQTETTDGLRVSISGQTHPYLLRILAANAPTKVTFNGIALDPERWNYDTTTQRLVIPNPDGIGGRYVID
ncbi:MAG: hypothetical protein L3K26_15795, partial [Candidatus Hydrogenedentes bacterium]|nr:hypothetical protein [Candidatus Hydrogenedentota bacterium]